MIVGIGTDICAIERIDKLMKSDKRRHFLDKSFTEPEQQMIPGPRQEAAFIAGRWAAKEAVAKALGTGFGARCSWLDITVERLESGAPQVVLAGVTAATAAELGIEHFHISISHERSHAVAFAVAES